MHTNFFSRKDIYFSFEAYIQRYTKYAILSWSIEYTNSVMIKVEQSRNPGIGCLSNIILDHYEKAKMH
jgi:hypothetical protein